MLHCQKLLIIENSMTLTYNIFQTNQRNVFMNTTPESTLKVSFNIKSYDDHNRQLQDDGPMVIIIIFDT